MTKKNDRRHQNKGGSKPKPAEFRRVPLFATVAPETKKLLQPYAAKERPESVGEIIDQALAAFLKQPY